MAAQPGPEPGAGRRPLPIRVGMALAAVLVGVLVGSIGAFLQAVRELWVVGDVVVIVPWGLVLALALFLVVIRGAGSLAGFAAARWAVLAGWLGATVLLAVESPSGDVAIAGGPRQVVYVLVGTIAGAAASTIPARGRVRRERQACAQGPAE